MPLVVPVRASHPKLFSSCLSFTFQKHKIKKVTRRQSGGEFPRGAVQLSRVLSGVVPCIEPSRLVPKALEDVAVSRSSYGLPACAHS